MGYLIAITIFAFTTTVTPGPNNVMIMTSGLNYGIKKSLPHFLGICIGFPIMVILIGVGIGSVFNKYPVIHTVIKTLSIIYLLYLSWAIARSKPGSFECSKSRPLTFVKSVLFQWVNPKAWIMATGAVATYAQAGSSLYAQTVIISLIFFIVAFPAVGAWLFFGLRLKAILKTESHQRTFNICMAFFLVASLLPVIFQKII